MTTTHHLNRTTSPKPKKLAARTVLAGGLGMAVMGLTAAMANADPAPPSTPDPGPPITATLHPTPPPPGQHSESGLCNQTVVPRDAPSPPPGYCG